MGSNTLHFACKHKVINYIIIIYNIIRRIVQLTVTISSISCRDMYPFPSKSYIENAHLSFCSNFPREVTLKAHKNSLKSIVPSPFASNVLNTCSAN